MRIIGGVARGIKIPSTRKGRVRPTPAVVREALFNILASVEGLSWLDLYAGTGSVGLEALSRGARRVVFVERNVTLAKQVSRSVSEMGCEEKAKIIEDEVKTALRRLARRGEVFDIVFADPPYDEGMIEKTIDIMRQTAILSVGGLLILQHSRREDVKSANLDPSWQVVDVRHYGDTTLTMIQYRPKEC
ncbi:MAG: 16S rRNA (guanine(966)-N(2))-methyltransferase RsmD [Syntrophales bacterium]|nr:16S rRNA (guanine(966)-N(2))-methyltransferase RsmD [Syntrophales bacterium]